MLKSISLFLITIPIVYIAIALALIVSNLVQSDFDKNDSKTLNFAEISSQDMSGLAELQKLDIDNASSVQYRYYKSSSPTDRLIVLIHGSGWHSMQYAQMATYLAGSGLGHIVTPDLRGHGENPHQRGDVDYIGQLEDDIAAIVADLKGKQNIKQVIVGGHSSGGGLVVRLAGGKHGAIVDGWLLMSPFLKYNAPTMRPDAGGWTNVLVRRTIGLAMLNNIGITVLNHLVSIQFNMPVSVRDGPLGHTATLAYSYRLNTSYAPRSDYEKDIASISKPMLLLVGENDEAFKADKFKPTLSALTNSGEYHLIPGLGHLNLTHDQATFDIIEDWLLKK